MSEQKRLTVRRSVIGVVSSDKMNKTIKVEVNVSVKHPAYEKRVNRRSVYTVHDEENTAKKGDLVEIQETRKLSKTKCFRLVKVLKKVEE